MTQDVTVTHQVSAVKSGVTVWPQIQLTTTYTVDTLFAMDLRLESGNNKMIAVAGTDVSLETDPIVLDSVDFRGWQIESDEAITVDINGLGAVPVKSGISDGVSITTLKVANASGLSANISLKVWGMKS